MAHPVSKSVAYGSSYVGIHLPTACYDCDAFLAAPIYVPRLTMPAYTMPEHGFTSLSGLSLVEEGTGSIEDLLTGS